MGEAMAGDPHLLVVMGFTGDLVRRKLLPALARLLDRGQWPPGSVLVGTSRDPGLDEARARELVAEALAEAGLAETTVRRFLEALPLAVHTVADGTTADYAALAGRLEAIEAERGLPGNRVFYLALPPQALAAAIAGLGQADLARSRGWTRVVVEKPFGHDLGSARRLNELVHHSYTEDQIYRIDHYLGKETVQNLLVFRFANPVFESLWNRDRVESVEITVAETLGIGRRASYYESAGVVRDMVQNHLLQLLALLAMEVPSAFDARAIRHEKVKVMSAIGPIGIRDLVYGQYSVGQVDGQVVPGYRQEPGVRPDSRTPTYVAMRVAVDNWRWQGVPFFLRTGKRLARQITQVAVVFKRAPVYIFAPYDECAIRRNVLFLTLQPDEGFDLHFQVKAPGSPFRTETQQLRFAYQEVFGPLPDAYETLLVDVFVGDQTLFVRADEVESAWALCGDFLDPPEDSPLHEYPAGSWGPAEARALPGAVGSYWHVR